MYTFYIYTVIIVIAIAIWAASQGKSIGGKIKCALASLVVSAVVAFVVSIAFAITSSIVCTNPIVKNTYEETKQLHSIYTSSKLTGSAYYFLFVGGASIDTIDTVYYWEEYDGGFVKKSLDMTNVVIYEEDRTDGLITYVYEKQDVKQSNWLWCGKDSDYTPTLTRINLYVPDGSIYSEFIIK